MVFANTKMNKFASNLAEAVREIMKDPVFVQRLRRNTNGKIFWAYKSTDAGYAEFVKHHPDYPDGTPAVYTTVGAAYDAMTSNQNDVCLINGHGSFSEAMLTVSKNRCHFEGMDGGGRRNSMGAKLSTPATDVAASVAVVKITGTRNTFKNIKFIQQGTNAAQTSGVIDEGEGTYMKNCEMEVNSILSTASQGLLFKGDTCHYEDCQIGNSTVTHTAANQAPLVIKTPARYSYFINCTMINFSDKTTASLIDVPDANGIIGWIMFENCRLINARKGDGANAQAEIAEAVTSVCTSGYLLFDSRCTSYQCALFSEADASIYHAGQAAAGDSAAKGGLAEPAA